MYRNLADSCFGFDVFFVFLVDADERDAVLFLYVVRMKLTNLVDARPRKQGYQRQPKTNAAWVIGADLVIIAPVVLAPRI